MPTTSLGALAHHLDIPERTLRRAASQGLVRGERKSARRFETSLSEEAYLREHWPLLRALRAALRTEPSVRCALLFGSLATGRGHARSDVDLLVSLSDPSPGHVAELTGRLERQLGREVQLVRLQDAENAPLLMRDALQHGRVLVDRDDQWPQLKSRRAAWDRLAAEAEPVLLDVMESLDDADAG